MLSNQRIACWLVSLAVLLAACHREIRVPPGITTGPAGGPVVRVRLAAGSTVVKLGAAEAGLLISDAGSGGKIALLSPGAQWDAVRFGPDSELRVSMPDGRVSRHHPDGIRVEALGEPQVVKVNGNLYRGRVFVYLDGQKNLTVINTLPLEQYIRSVVPAEIGALEDRYFEALKAQAVASRSFALAQMVRNRSYSFDLTADTGDQVYKGLASESPQADRAVNSTGGECLTSSGRVITAFYHSTCGGRTADPQEVWGKSFAKENPYLESVKDGDHDRDSKWNSWRVKWTRQELLDGIKKALPSIMSLSASEIGEPKDIEIVEKGHSGRNTLLKVATDKRIFQITGDRIRNVLRTPEGRLLPSTFFTLSVARESAGPVIIAEGRGFGHGLGMCQSGAKSRAADGDSYTHILKQYYKKVKIVRMY
ncbi:MAG TPA: SpoIID/LytB domain-containing protein [archaeon]|nr:SpoIID/LytB domain-containing protein [archaeon]